MALEHGRKNWRSDPTTRVSELRIAWIGVATELKNRLNCWGNRIERRLDWRGDRCTAELCTLMRAGVLRHADNPR